MVDQAKSFFIIGDHGHRKNRSECLLLHDTHPRCRSGNKGRTQKSEAVLLKGAAAGLDAGARGDSIFHKFHKRIYGCGTAVEWSQLGLRVVRIAGNSGLHQYFGLGQEWFSNSAMQKKAFDSAA